MGWDTLTRSHFDLIGTEIRKYCVWWEAGRECWEVECTFRLYYLDRGPMAWKSAEAWPQQTTINIL